MEAMENLKIRIAEEDDMLVWDQFIDSSSMGSIFHKSSWLQATVAETKTELLPLMGFWGDRILFVLPLFLRKMLGFRCVFSPPPKCLIPEMGLVLSFDSNKRELIEKKYFLAIDAIHSFIQKELKVNYIRIINPVGMTDMRPFLWLNYRIKPRYTYYISLKQEENLLYQKMKSQVRTHIRRAEKYSDLEFFNGDRNTFFELIQLVRERYEEQNISLSVSNSYLGKIYDELSKNNQILIKGIRNTDHFLTGLILLKYNKRIHHWIGGVAPKGKYTGINELMHWEVIKESRDTSLSHYDLVGANTRHLCRYKSKFNPELSLYFQVEKGNVKGNMLRFLYDRYLNKYSRKKS